MDSKSGHDFIDDCYNIENINNIIKYAFVSFAFGTKRSLVQILSIRLILSFNFKVPRMGERSSFQTLAILFLTFESFPILVLNNISITPKAFHGFVSIRINRS